MQQIAIEAVEPFLAGKFSTGRSVGGGDPLPPARGIRPSPFATMAAMAKRHTIVARLARRGQIDAAWSALRVLRTMRDGVKR